MPSAPQDDTRPADPDAVLLRRFVEQGDRAALEALFDRHLADAHRLASRLCRHAADADDVVQAACLKAMRKAASWRPTGSVRSWLLAIVANTAIDDARIRSRRQRHEGEFAATARGAAAEEDLREPL